MCSFHLSPEALPSYSTAASEREQFVSRRLRQQLTCLPVLRACFSIHWLPLTSRIIADDSVFLLHLFQKINHFPGMIEICRKDLLARNLNRMLKLFPKEYNIFPRTWSLPAE